MDKATKENLQKLLVKGLCEQRNLNELRKAFQKRSRKKNKPFYPPKKEILMSGKEIEEFREWQKKKHRKNIKEKIKRK